MDETHYSNDIVTNYCLDTVVHDHIIATVSQMWMGYF